MVSNSITMLFVVNAPEYFVSHRLPLALAAQSYGWDVHVASKEESAADTSAVEEIERSGFVYHNLPINRGGQNPLQEVFSVYKVYGLMKRLKPDIVHLITIKPVLYGGLAARWAGVPSVLAAVAGLGTIFIAQTPLAKLRRWLVSTMLKLALKREHVLALFQNPDDLEVLLSKGLLNPSQARMIRGSGVKLSRYPYSAERAGRPVVVMASRLLKEKGVVEFIEAARLLRKRNVEVDMRLMGSPDSSNPSSISEHDLNRWREEGVVQVLGYRKDVAQQYTEANIVCLPSYREGLPKSLVEAAACGRAIVTTDVPGCRDAITPGVTGLLVPVKDAAALADGIQQLVEDPQLRKRMGYAGRLLAEEAFAIEKIVEQHMNIYKELLPDG